MTAGTVFTQGWTLDDVHWSRFDASKIEPSMLAAIKAAALVEFNAPDYVSYLNDIAGVTVKSPARAPKSVSSQRLESNRMNHPPWGTTYGIP